MMQHVLFCLAGLTVLAAPALPITGEWAADTVWDDGLAEVAIYEASRTLYGVPRSYEAVLITVKEDLDDRTLVKADPPLAERALVAVLKQNAVREIPTESYDYRIMTSTFVDRGNPQQLVRLTSGSHEWCGNTWKTLRRDGDQATYAWSSYFDGEAEGRQRLEFGPQDLLEDQLPLTLRGVTFRVGLRFAARLLPSFSGNHAGPTAWRQAVFAVTGRETLDLPAGKLDAFRIDARAGDWSGSFWFDAGKTHPLVQLESSAGDRLRLKRLERRAFWLRPAS